MIIKRLITLVSIFLFLNQNYAQDKSTVSPRDFSHIKDTTSYHNAVDDFRKTLQKRTDTISIKEIDAFIQLGVKLNYTKGIGKAYVVKALIYRNKLEYSLAEKNYQKAITYFNKINYQKAIAVVHNELYITEKQMGNLEKSAYYLLEAKNYFEKIQDSIPLIVMYNNLGRIHMELEDYEFSEEAFSKSILLIKKSGEYKDELGTIMNNLAEVYIEHKKYDEAEAMAKESIRINKKDSLIGVFAYSYATLGEIAIAKEEYHKARKLYDSSLYYYSKGGDNIMTIDTKQRIGYIELQLGNIKEAEKMFTITREAYRKIDSKANLLENYELSSKLDSVTGNLVGAIAWQHRYQELSDEIASESSLKKIEKREEFYARELKQLRTIDEQEIREQKNKEELFRYKVIAFIILGILLISFVFVLWIVKTRKERKKLITKLNESNEVKNKLFSIISHDLKNEIHGLEGSLNLMKEDVISTEEFKEIVPLLANRTHQTSILLNNLLNWSKSQMKELNPNPITFDITEVIKDKFIFFKPKADKKNIALINKLDATVIFADKDMFGIVAQNLIANAIKFCNPNDSITLVSIEKEDHYEICFEDTGVGIASSNLNKLFAENTFTTNGTQNESGTGLGLRICKELIELNQGSIKVDSTLGEGSIFYVILPKAK
ncbi:tetratricopeptide repeat-containing sensor histidine kinase [Aquimarina sp. 2201CG14-23]|uniref:tetratricopeptide repeat-containing sensor histidine kinase n=1 Tax=Aquimarina mycalae TaxID=3040073 RepID=UPI002477FBC5|nr:tetratricopeptide repeat-containing sensor histidine kinase [Aquimarina sp. 2201CG14-23]MDH7444210.1 tetratricopeptide repeat-containing sensor histidine kinase [Aquimarina sp. 2201CG14-23]